MGVPGCALVGGTTGSERSVNVGEFGQILWIGVASVLKERSQEKEETILTQRPQGNAEFTENNAAGRSKDGKRSFGVPLDGYKFSVTKRTGDDLWKRQVLRSKE